MEAGVELGVTYPNPIIEHTFGRARLRSFSFPALISMNAVRHLVIVLGDQLDLDSPVLKELDCERDLVWMAEVSEESTQVWSHKQRITLFCRVTPLGGSTTAWCKGGL